MLRKSALVLLAVTLAACGKSYKKSEVDDDAERVAHRLAVSADSGGENAEPGEEMAESSSYAPDVRIEFSLGNVTSPPIPPGSLTLDAPCPSDGSLTCRTARIDMETPSTGVGAAAAAGLFLLSNSGEALQPVSATRIGPRHPGYRAFYRVGGTFNWVRRNLSVGSWFLSAGPGVNTRRWPDFKIATRSDAYRMAVKILDIDSKERWMIRAFSRAGQMLAQAQIRAGQRFTGDGNVTQVTVTAPEAVIAYVTLTARADLSNARGEWIGYGLDDVEATFCP